MIIVSQDGKLLVNSQNIVTISLENMATFAILARTTFERKPNPVPADFEEDDIELGSYKDEKKLQNVFEGLISAFRDNASVFRMPPDVD